MNLNINLESTILIFTDGACSGNPGPGGFGSIIIYPNGTVQELGQKQASTTNNRMEMTAVIRALESIGASTGEVWVMTDSTYIIYGITKLIWSWKRKNWKTSQGDPVKNKDLWQELDRVVSQREKINTIQWNYVRGHSNIPGNHRCDEIAVAFSKNKPPRLYSGSLLNYPVAVHDLPEDMSPPPMKPRTTVKKKVHSYLSYVNGTLQRHQTWKECEANVKGRSKAKFKKSTSHENEREIVKIWGLNPEILDSLD